MSGVTVTHVPADLGTTVLDTAFLETRVKRTKSRVHVSLWSGERQLASAQGAQAPVVFTDLIDSCINPTKGSTIVDPMFRGAALRWARFNHFSF